MTAIFVTATGTDIGKTFVAAGLIRHWRAAGSAVTALKPVVTGFYPAEADGSDPGLLLAAQGKSATLAQIEAIAPWRFTAPVSPDMAARRENRTLDFDALVKFCRDAMAANTATLLIEGVGGVMVPLGERHTVLDWMAALEMPLVVVTGSYLGSISHTLTALDVLRQRGLVTKALVVNETAGSPVPVAHTIETLMHFAEGIPIVPLPRRPAGVTSHAAFAEIAKLL